MGDFNPDNYQDDFLAGKLIYFISVIMTYISK